MKYEEIEPHIIDFIKGNLDESLEYRIKAYLKENPDFQKEIDELRDTLDFVQDVPFEDPDLKLKMEFYAMLNSYQADHQEEKTSILATISQYLQSKIFVQRIIPLASVIFLAGYFTSVLLNQTQKAEQATSTIAMEETVQKQINPDSPKDDSQYASKEVISEDYSPPSLDRDEPTEVLALTDEEVDAEADLDIILDSAPELVDAREDTGDISLVTGSRARSTDDIMLEGRSIKTLESDERIQNIYTSLENKSQDEVIIQALIKALNSDPNPNVRIAAIDALEKFAERNQVKYLIAKSLDNQSSATVQLATIDLIVKYQIKEGVQSIKKLLVQPELNQTVRQQAEIALEIIS